jgi:hypothetical protein
MLIAQAQSGDMTLVSADAMFVSVYFNYKKRQRAEGRRQKVRKYNENKSC